MMAKILILFIGVTSILSCNKDNDGQATIEGQYVGTFQRGGNSSKVELTLSSENFSGESDTVKFPAICNGNYSIWDRTIEFENQCPWTAEFDWSLILGGTWNFNIDNEILILTNSIGDKYTLEKQ
jgi:hypothetical protein